MKEVIHGNITFPNKIDITDPCYDEDVWCRVNNFPIEPGTYECFTHEIQDESCGHRIAGIGIRNNKCTYYERKAMIGVDSGMAGFFNCDNRLIMEEIVGGNDDVYLFENAFLSSSGYGDGGYDVYAGYRDGEVVEVYIKFIGEEDE